MEERKMERIRNFFKDESGATMVEYGLMVALIAVIAMVGAATLGTAVNTKFGEASTSVSS
jgi:pilus assembly protein Flp/PilA